MPEMSDLCYLEKTRMYTLSLMLIRSWLFLLSSQQNVLYLKLHNMAFCVLSGWELPQFRTGGTLLWTGYTVNSMRRAITQEDFHV